MKNDNHTLEFLVELDETIIERLLNIETHERIVSLIQNASTNAQSYILASLEKNKAESVSELLRKEELKELKK